MKPNQYEFVEVDHLTTEKFKKLLFRLKNDNDARNVAINGGLVKFGKPWLTPGIDGMEGLTGLLDTLIPAYVAAELIFDDDDKHSVPGNTKFTFNTEMVKWLEENDIEMIVAPRYYGKDAGSDATVLHFYFDFGDYIAG